jgi:hypothetical protein
MKFSLFLSSFLLAIFCEEKWDEKTHEKHAHDNNKRIRNVYENLYFSRNARDMARCGNYFSRVGFRWSDGRKARWGNFSSKLLKNILLKFFWNFKSHFSYIKKFSIFTTFHEKRKAHTFCGRRKKNMYITKCSKRRKSYYCIYVNTHNLYMEDIHGIYCAVSNWMMPKKCNFIIIQQQP